jgi:hypothetical protein
LTWGNKTDAKEMFLLLEHEKLFLQVNFQRPLQQLINHDYPGYKTRNDKTMKMATIFSALIMLNAILFTTSCKEITDENHIHMDYTNDVCDSITNDSFLIIAKGIKQKMNNHNKFSIEESIIMVKVYNTMHQELIVNDKKVVGFITDYKKMFLKEYMPQVNKQLECSYGKGMTVYSKKHDLYIGIGSIYRCRDIYTILN